MNGVCLEHEEEQKHTETSDLTSATMTPAESPKDASPNHLSGYTDLASESTLMNSLKVENGVNDSNSGQNGGVAGVESETKLLLLPRNSIVKRVLSIHEKLEICERARIGEKKTKLAREYGVQPPAITKVVQNERKWKAFVANSREMGASKQTDNEARKRGRKRPRLFDADDKDAGATCQELALHCDKSDLVDRLNPGLRFERSISAPTENGLMSLGVLGGASGANAIGVHSCASDQSDSSSSNELSIGFAAAIGGARTCLEVLTRLNANLVAQAVGSGAQLHGTNGLAGAEVLNIVPEHWFHALLQIEHFFNLLVQQQSQLEHSQ